MSKVKLDFTGVESFQRPSEGQHVAKIISAEVKASQGGSDMIVCNFEVTKGQDKGSRVYENFPLSEKALWKLKGMLQAIGMKADGKVQLDLDRLIGKVCIIEVVDDEYNGNIRAKIDNFKKLAAVADEDEDVEDVDDSDDEDDEDEAPAPAPKKEKAKKTKKEEPIINPPVDDEDDDEDDWDDEDEEEEPAPKRAPKKAEKKKAPKKVEPVEEDEDDDDDDWDEE